MTVELEQAQRIADLLRKNGFDPEEVIGRLRQVRLNEWETTIATEDGPETVTNHGVSVVLNATDGDGPAVAVQQASPLDVTIRTPRRLPRRQATDGHWAIVYPDAQRPSVDHAAVDVGHQILADLEAEHGVDTIIHLGDDLDLPDFSTHRSAPEVLGRVNEAINDQHRILAIERALAPNSAMHWLAGNHEQRLINWLIDNAPQLVGIRRAGGTADEEIVLSVPSLCRLDELGVDYIDPYPEGEVWLNDHLRAIHGDVVKPGKGATGSHFLTTGHMSTMFGHTHRKELVFITRHTKDGPRTYMAGSPGCLARIDGKVPSSKSGIGPAGKQGMRRTEDWQQGIWVVWYQSTGRQLYAVEPVSIWGGWAMWRGREYRARCDVDGNPIAEAA